MAKSDKKTNKNTKEKIDRNKTNVKLEQHEVRGLPVVDLPAKLVQSIADEVAKNVMNRLPHIPLGPKKAQKLKIRSFWIPQPL